jgi:hypothetical protein
LDATFNVVLALDLEVDPARFPLGFSVARAVTRTMKVVTDLTERVKASSGAFPVVLRLLIRHVEKEITPKSVVGFGFLWFCFVYLLCLVVFFVLFVFVVLIVLLFCFGLVWLFGLYYV